MWLGSARHTGLLSRRHYSVHVGEFIRDTEEYINIELDSSRNRLIRLEIVITAGTFGVGIFGLVAGNLFSFAALLLALWIPMLSQALHPLLMPPHTTHGMPGVGTQGVGCVRAANESNFSY